MPRSKEVQALIKFAGKSVDDHCRQIKQDAPCKQQCILGGANALATLVHLKSFDKDELARVFRKAELATERYCDKPEVGVSCRPICQSGGMAAVAPLARGLANAGLEGKFRSRLGIIVSPREKCPANFERIIVPGGRNKKVHLCRLGKEVRKKWAPEGKPARIGPLRRKTRPPYRRGVITRDILEE